MPTCAQKKGTKNHRLDIKIQPYGLIFRQNVEETECDKLFFLVKLTLLFKIKRRNVLLSGKRHIQRKQFIKKSQLRQEQMCLQDVVTICIRHIGQ